MVCHSALGFVEFCDGNYEGADGRATQMRHEAEHVGWEDVPEDRSEPDHVEALLALGDLRRARRILDRLEWRGRTLPRPSIEATLPRARALILRRGGDVTAALALLEAAPEDPALPFEQARLLLVRGQIERRAEPEAGGEAVVGGRRSRSSSSSGRRRGPSGHQAEIGRLGLRHRSPDELTATPSG